MRIGRFAALAGLSPRQVRYYTDENLLPTVRLSNGYRDYDEDEVERARRLRSLFAVGLTVDEVRVLSPCLSDSSTAMCAATTKALTMRLADLDAQIDGLREARALIQRRLDAAA